jgi:hypothetical protein
VKFSKTNLINWMLCKFYCCSLSARHVKRLMCKKLRRDACMFDFVNEQMNRGIDRHARHE